MSAFQTYRKDWICFGCTADFSLSSLDFGFGGRRFFSCLNSGLRLTGPILPIPLGPCAVSTLSSVQFSHSVLSDSLRPRGLQHTRLPRPSPTPRACSNSCPWSQWCHTTISSFVVPFSSCLQSFPAPRSFPISQFFTSGGQSTRASASSSASVLPMNI